jgi:hypothetical protein
MKTNKIQQILVLISSIILFLIGCNRISMWNPEVAVPLFVLSIMLYQAASHISLSLKIDELRKHMNNRETENNSNPGRS